MPAALSLVSRQCRRSRSSKHKRTEAAGPCKPPQERSAGPPPPPPRRRVQGRPRDLDKRTVGRDLPPPAESPPSCGPLYQWRRGRQRSHATKRRRRQASRLGFTFSALRVGPSRWRGELGMSNKRRRLAARTPSSQVVARACARGREHSFAAPVDVQAARGGPVGLLRFRSSARLRFAPAGCRRRPLGPTAASRPERVGCSASTRFRAAAAPGHWAPLLLALQAAWLPVPG